MNIIEMLHPLERKVLPFLKEEKTLKGLVKKTGLKEVEVMRALQWLENKGLLKIKIELKEIVTLDKFGKKYCEEGLPEKKFLTCIKDGEKTIQEIKEKTKLNNNEINACIGILKNRALIEFKKGGLITITKEGKLFLERETLEEKFLKKLNVCAELDVSSLQPEEKFAVEELKKRKGLINVNIKKIRSIELTEYGRKLLEKGIPSKEVIDSVTPEILSTGSWKNKIFRKYDVRINVPKIFGGKRHFVNYVVDYIKRIWLDMGFREMKGPLLLPSFWNFDALFVPQDHPAREMQDTFYIKSPKKGKLPKKELVERIRKVHENGYTTGSKGWGYKWEAKKAELNILRTQTTAVSAMTLANLDLKELPMKFFAIGKNFRNEAPDWSHSFEFIQTEGIVIDKNANLRHLIGYLKEFFGKMGYKKIRVKPSFFPFTEPSMEVEVYDPKRKEWMEIAGAGIFRPEVTKPLLGKEIPVLAWGIGVDRMMFNCYDIKDIRIIRKNDISFLREVKLWLT